MGAVALGLDHVWYGEAYEVFMGRWSARLAPPLVQFAAVADGDAVLDVGSGTGALAAAVAAMMPSSHSSASIRPSHTLPPRGAGTDPHDCVLRWAMRSGCRSPTPASTGRSPLSS